MIRLYGNARKLYKKSTWQALASSQGIPLVFVIQVCQQAAMSSCLSQKFLETCCTMFNGHTMHSARSCSMCTHAFALSECHSSCSNAQVFCSNAQALQVAIAVMGKHTSHKYVYMMHKSCWAYCLISGLAIHILHIHMVCVQYLEQHHLIYKNHWVHSSIFGFSTQYVDTRCVVHLQYVELLYLIYKSYWVYSLIFGLLAVVALMGIKADVVRQHKILAGLLNQRGVVPIVQGGWVRALPAYRLVPGDIIVLQEGRPTCDVVLLQGNCLVSESMLSGEVAYAVPSLMLLFSLVCCAVRCCAVRGCAACFVVLNFAACCF